MFFLFKFVIDVFGREYADREGNVPQELFLFIFLCFGIGQTLVALLSMKYN